MRRAAGWKSLGLPVAGCDVDEAMAAAIPPRPAYLCGAAQETEIELLKYVGLKMHGERGDRMGFDVGIDIGGTFTDFCAIA